MTCYGFKGGSETASRPVAFGSTEHVVGVFVQANFGRRRELRIVGEPEGRLLSEDNPEEDEDWFAPSGAGSVIAVVATDAPLLPGSTANDNALASRLNTPAAVNHAQSNPEPGGYASLQFVPWGAIDPFYDAVVQATEEAVINTLVGAVTTVGIDHHRSPALPTDSVAQLFAHEQ